MDYFAGLDVSVKETRVCIVDDAAHHLSLQASWAGSLVSPSA
jgi:hypothetical protein